MSAAGAQFAAPLVDLLRGVPEDARVQIHVAPLHSRFIPVGRYCNEAADRIAALEAALAEARDMAHAFMLDRPVRNADEAFARWDALLGRKP